MTKAPCYHCDKRSGTCRIGCAEYKDWQTLHIEEKIKINKSERDSYCIGRHDFDMFEKSGRKQRWK